MPVYKAIFKFALNIIDLTFKGIVENTIFILIKPQLEASIKQRDSGKRGWVAKTSTMIKNRGYKGGLIMIKKISYNGNYERSTSNNNGLLPYRELFNNFRKKYRESKRWIGAE